MKRVAIISFPGNNCEVESVRAIKRAGMEAVPFRWNDSLERLEEIDGYFLPGGFSYEDRGRAGMIAARDPLFEHIAREVESGKVVIGNCNGAQMLVESGLIPLGGALDMSIARNVVNGKGAGFLNEWVWITPSCSKDRCATSDWEGAMHVPIAHGEGRFTTRDADLLDDLKANNQIAFQYCDAEGNVSEDPSVTPNGSLYAIAGICNPAGNVVALMPHPERTTDGDAYFVSMRRWIENGGGVGESSRKRGEDRFAIPDLSKRPPRDTEIFIDTIIVNNEERTVEQALHTLLPDVKLKQLRYYATKKDPQDVLSRFSIFNPNKEVAYVRRGQEMYRYNADTKTEEPCSSLFNEGVSFLRRDDPDTGTQHLGENGESGVCYVCTGVTADDLLAPKTRELFGNPHASTLEFLV